MEWEGAVHWRQMLPNGQTLKASYRMKMVTQNQAYGTITFVKTELSSKLRFFVSGIDVLSSRTCIKLLD